MAKTTFGTKAGRIQTSQKATATTETPEQAMVKLRAEAAARGQSYREQSLKLHPHVCARCAREFSGVNLKLLTVHHRDGDHDNNPPDGSNWENLCVYCHDDAHSRELLGDYEGGRGGGGDNSRLVASSGPASGSGLGTLADLLLKAKAKK
jgi:hypothetical protein